jgi:hypothetical protein
VIDPDPVPGAYGCDVFCNFASGEQAHGAYTVVTTDWIVLELG